MLYQKYDPSTRTFETRSSIADDYRADVSSLPLLGDVTPAHAIMTALAASAVLLFAATACDSCTKPTAPAPVFAKVPATAQPAAQEPSKIFVGKHRSQRAISSHTHIIILTR